jgi:hypothetical protein
MAVASQVDAVGGIASRERSRQNPDDSRHSVQPVGSRRQCVQRRPHFTGGLRQLARGLAKLGERGAYRLLFLFRHLLKPQRLQFVLLLGEFDLRPQEPGALVGMLCTADPPGQVAQGASRHPSRNRFHVKTPSDFWTMTTGAAKQAKHPSARRRPQAPTALTCHRQKGP